MSIPWKQKILQTIVPNFGCFEIPTKKIVFGDNLPVSNGLLISIRYVLYIYQPLPLPQPDIPTIVLSSRTGEALPASFRCGEKFVVKKLLRPFRSYTGMSMEVSNYLVSWFKTYFRDLQPTYIGISSIYEVPWTSQYRDNQSQNRHPHTS